MVTMTKTVRKLRGLIAERGAQHQEVAALIGVHPAQFSLILRERRPMPEGFEEKVRTALDRLEAAERATSIRRLQSKRCRRSGGATVVSCVSGRSQGSSIGSPGRRRGERALMT